MSAGLGEGVDNYLHAIRKMSEETLSKQ